jgi:copper/silver efflux system protein
MLVYLDEAYEQRVCDAGMATVHDLREAIMEGEVLRVRPKVMTFAAMGGDAPSSPERKARADRFSPDWYL